MRIDLLERREVYLFEAARELKTATRVPV